MLAVAALEHRRIGVLWQRESRHLPPDARERLRAVLVEIMARVAAFVGRRRPDLGAADLNLLAWPSAPTWRPARPSSASTCPVPSTSTCSPASSTGVVATDLDLDRTAITAPPPLVHLDRRDELLAAAARLFAQRGYHSVGVDDVGATVDMAGPSIYHHFATKLDLIVAVIDQGADQLLDSTARALADARDDAEALDALLGAYVAFSLTHSDLMDVLITEVPHLPEPHRTRFRGTQRHYLDRWLDVLVGSIPTWHAHSCASASRPH